MEEALPTAPNPHKTVTGTELFSTPAQEMETQGEINPAKQSQEETNTTPNSQGTQDNDGDSTKPVAEDLDPRLAAAQKD